MIHLALCIALGILLVPIIFQLCALAVLIVCAPFALIRHEIKLWSK